MGTVSLWLVGIAVVALVAWAYSTWTLKRPVPLQLRRGLGLLRILFLVSLVILLAGPRVSREIQRPKTSHLVVLIDDSESMSLPADFSAGTAPTRLDMVKDLLDAEFTRRLARQNLAVSFWRLSDLAPIRDLSRLEANAPTTPLGQSLKDLAAKFEHTDLKAILTLSDGQNTHGPSPARVASQLGVPVFTVGLGPSQAVWEVAIDELIVPEQAFQQEQVPIHVVLSRRGTAEEEELSVMMRLFIDTRLVSESNLRFNPGQVRYEWQTEEVFDTLGTHQIRVEIIPELPRSQFPPKSIQDSQWNASASLVILKNRYNVVILCGKPDWETKFLRRALEEDPRLDVLALWPNLDGNLVIVRPTDPTRQPTLLESLLQTSPSVATVMENLSTIDLLILAQLSWQGRRGSQLTAANIGSVIEWVEQEGGALLVLGGEEMFGAGGKSFALLKPILPVEVRGQNDYRTTPIFPVLTEAGRRSEALASLRQVEMSKLGPLDTSHILEKPRLGAEVLLEDGQGNPLLAWHTYGLGRVMVFATTSFWKYGLPLAETRAPRRGAWQFLAGTDAISHPGASRQRRAPLYRRPTVLPQRTGAHLGGCGPQPAWAKSRRSAADGIAA